MGGPNDWLLERGSELERLDALRRRLDAGDGAVVLIEGPPGIGKTSLLETLVHRQNGVRVLRALGGEFERELPFGLVRQLFERVCVDASPGDRRDWFRGAAALAAPVFGMPGPRTEDVFTVLHGLYWLMANMARSEKLLLVVDDAQWGDDASLSWLAYVGRRLGGLPVLLAIGWRTEEPDVEPRWLSQLERTAQVERPAALTPAAAVSLIGSALGSCDEEFGRACWSATRGNPFMLRELGAGLRADRIEPTAANVAAVDTLGPSGVARAALGRVAACGADAVAFAAATAVLGSAPSLAIAADLAGLSPEAAASTARKLEAAGVLRGSPALEFQHPIIRTVVYQDLSATERASAHARAASRLTELDAPPEAVAEHLLRADPTASERVVETLVRAAERARARGAPASAAQYLRRALAEPPPADERPRLLAKLGAASLRAGGGAEAIECYTEALERLTDARSRGLATRGLARALLIGGHPIEAVDALAGEIDELDGRDRELSLTLEADLNVIGFGHPDARRRAVARINRLRVVDGMPTTHGERVALAALALETAYSQPPARLAAELASHALSGGELLREEGSDSPAFYLAANALFDVDDLEPAGSIYSDAVADAQTRGSVRGYAIAIGWRAGVQLRRGSIEQAEADARQSLAQRGPAGLELAWGPALAFLIESLVEQGRTDEAEHQLSENEPLERYLGTVMAPFLLYARGRLHLAAGRWGPALKDLQRCGRAEAAWGVATPALTCWRADAAVAAARLGHQAEARATAEAALAQARAFGTARSIGRALRSAAAVGGEDAADRIELLSEAVERLTDSGAALELAHAHADLGTAHRHAGATREARAHLQKALTEARRGGASALYARSRDELQASGVRVSQSAARGAAGLTPSERRVAELAATGRSNREIAQALFVTVKTVEVHLSHAYSKLDISSRRELAGALDRH